MMTAYILAKIETGNEMQIFEKIKQLPEIRKAVATFGIYDLVIEVALDNIEGLDEFIFTKLRKIPGIAETVSMITSKVIV